MRDTAFKSDRARRVPGASAAHQHQAADTDGDGGDHGEAQPVGQRHLFGGVIGPGAFVPGQMALAGDHEQREGEAGGDLQEQDARRMVRAHGETQHLLHAGAEPGRSAARSAQPRTRRFRDAQRRDPARACPRFSRTPGTAGEIAQFCQRNYGVSFTMMDKVQGNGANAHAVFQWLKAEAPGMLGTEGIKWNFTKFLVGRDGRVVKRYAPQDAPAKLAGDIEAALG